MSDFFNPAGLLIIGFVLAFVPTLIGIGTSYAKIAIVLAILRNAFGANQVPPTFVINAIAGVVTLFIMAAPMQKAVQAGQAIVWDMKDLPMVTAGFQAVSQPFIDFMMNNTEAQETVFYGNLRDELWTPEARGLFTERSPFLVIPAFVTSEVKKAFKIGFIIYIPFIIIDILVSSIIVSVGMSSVSPNIITLPLKFLLFVYVDGWLKLVNVLVRSYAM